MADPAEWFTNPEHAHIIGLDEKLTQELGSFFEYPEFAVECGVEGKGSYTYHFRIAGVPPGIEGKVTDKARDLIGAWTPYRFEVQCI